MSTRADALTEQQRTPGPWRVAPASAYTSGGINVDAGENGTGGYVCLVGGSNDDEQAKADARLIAAAPDMLAALKLQEVAEAFHLTCNVCEGNEIPELCEACFPHYDDARIARRAAIAKAEGAEHRGGG